MSLLNLIKKAEKREQLIELAVQTQTINDKIALFDQFAKIYDSHCHEAHRRLDFYKLIIACENKEILQTEEIQKMEMSIFFLANREQMDTTKFDKMAATALAKTDNETYYAHVVNAIKANDLCYVVNIYNLCLPKIKSDANIAYLASKKFNEAVDAMVRRDVNGEKLENGLLIDVWGPEYDYYINTSSKDIPICVRTKGEGVLVKYGNSSVLEKTYNYFACVENNLRKFNELSDEQLAEIVKTLPNSIIISKYGDFRNEATKYIKDKTILEPKEPIAEKLIKIKGKKPKKENSITAIDKLKTALPTITETEANTLMKHLNEMRLGKNLS